MNLNCPNCGTANEPEVRFCVDCGTPLESAFPGVSAPMEDDDNDRTIMSRVPLVAEDAKTVAVNQDDLAAAEAEFKPKSPPPARQPSAAAPPPAAGGSNQRKMIIIGVIVLLVLCCCCTLAIVGLAWSDAFNEIMDTVGAITTYAARNVV